MRIVGVRTPSAEHDAGGGAETGSFLVETLSAANATLDAGTAPPVSLGPAPLLNATNTTSPAPLGADGRDYPAWGDAAFGACTLEATWDQLIERKVLNSKPCTPTP